MMENVQMKEQVHEYLAGLGDDELIALFKDANAYDGSFEQVDYYEDLETLVGIAFGSPGWETPYDAICRVFFGDVDNLSMPVRLNGYANVETVTEAQIAQECRDDLMDMVDWVMENWREVELPAELEDALAKGEE